MPSCDWTEYEDATLKNDERMRKLNSKEDYVNNEIAYQEKRKLVILQEYLEKSEELEKIRMTDKDEKVSQYVKEHRDEWYEDYKRRVFKEEREKIMKDVENKVKEQMISKLDW